MAERQQPGFTTEEGWNQAYSAYYNVIRIINRKIYDALSTKDKDFTQWLQEYQQQAVDMQQLYRQNADFMADHIEPYIQHEREWDKETADALLSYLFVQCMRLEDTRMVYASANSLLLYYEHEQAAIAVMKCHYILGVCLHYLDTCHFSKEILYHCEKGIQLYEKYYRELSDKEKSYGLSLYDLRNVNHYETLQGDRFMPMYLETVFLPEICQSLAMLERFMSEADMCQEYNKVLPMLRFSMLNGFCSVALQVSKKNFSKDIAVFFKQLVKECSQTVQSCDDPLERADSAILLLMLSSIYGSLDAELVVKGIMREIHSIPEAEQEDENRSNARMGVWMNALSCVHALMEAEHANVQEAYDELFHYIVDFLAQPHFGKSIEHAGDISVFNFISDQLGHLHSIQETFESMMKLMVFRQVQTGIHSLMVRDCATLITDAVIDCCPQLFIGQLACESVKEVMAKKTDFLRYIRIASLLHDIGKVCCSSVINMQYRKLSDIEYRTIQFHPQSSKEILERIPQFLCFRDIALGHHKSFDGSFGYPAEFDNTVSPQKIFIDIITICDSLDAATDTYGRNYAVPKKFDDVMGEMRIGAGTRYSDRIVQLIDAHAPLKTALKELLEQQRENACRQTYEVLKGNMAGIV